MGGQRMGFVINTYVKYFSGKSNLRFPYFITILNLQTFWTTLIFFFSRNIWYNPDTGNSWLIECSAAKTDNPIFIFVVRLAKVSRGHAPVILTWHGHRNRWVARVLRDQVTRLLEGENSEKYLYICIPNTLLAIHLKYLENMLRHFARHLNKLASYSSEKRRR